MIFEEKYDPYYRLTAHFTITLSLSSDSVHLALMVVPLVFPRKASDEPSTTSHLARESTDLLMYTELMWKYVLLAIEDATT